MTRHYLFAVRVDIMTRLRAMPEFTSLWGRRTTLVDDDGVEYHLPCIPDLVQAKKTQCSKDWPVIELLVTIHHRQNASRAVDDHVEFWLREARTPELLVALCQRFPAQAAELTASRPLIRLARARSLDDLRAALDAEVRAEQARDRECWEPLRREQATCEPLCSAEMVAAVPVPGLSIFPTARLGKMSAIVFRGSHTGTERAMKYRYLEVQRAYVKQLVGESYSVSLAPRQAVDIKAFLAQRKDSKDVTSPNAHFAKLSVPFTDGTFHALLDHIGAQGWENYSVLKSGEVNIYYFRRQASS